VCWNPASRRKKGKNVATDAGEGVEAGRGCWWDGGQVSQTLDAVLQKGQTMPEKNRFPAVLQPVVIDRAAFNQGENAQYIPHIEQTDVMDSLLARGPHAVGVPFRKSKRAQTETDHETWVEADASNTLNNFDLGDTRTTHAVVEPIAFTQNQRDEIRELGDKAGALSSSTGTHQTNYIAQQQVYENHPNDSRITGPLEVAPTVVSRFGTGGGNVPLAQWGMAVRRLTPVECERLQGFPDNWSQIPWKGKPAEECPDGPRYKCAGNSMAVPCMRWIGEQIARVESQKI